MVACPDCGNPILSQPPELPPADVIRPLLIQARLSCKRGDLIASGCQLREGISRYLAAAIEQHGIRRPMKVSKSGKVFPKPGNSWNARSKIAALRKARVLCDCDREWMHDILDNCHKLAHCEELSPSLVECCISITAAIFDERLIEEWCEEADREEEGGAA